MLLISKLGSHTKRISSKLINTCILKGKGSDMSNIEISTKSGELKRKWRRKVEPSSNSRTTKEYAILTSTRRI